MDKLVEKTQKALQAMASGSNESCKTDAEKDHPLRRKNSNLCRQVHELMRNQPATEPAVQDVLEGLHKLLEKSRLRLESVQVSIVEEPLPQDDEVDDLMDDEDDVLGGGTGSAFVQREERVEKVQRLLDSNESLESEVARLRKDRTLFFNMEANRLREELRKLGEVVKKVRELPQVQSVLGRSSKSLEDFVNELMSEAGILLESIPYVTDTSVAMAEANPDVPDLTDPSDVLVSEDFADSWTLLQSVQGLLKGTLEGLREAHGRRLADERVQVLTCLCDLMAKMNEHVEKCIPYLPYNPDLSVKRKRAHDMVVAAAGSQKIRSSARLWEKRTECLRQFQRMQQGSVMTRLDRQTMDMEMRRCQQRTAAQSSSNTSSSSGSSASSTTSGVVAPSTTDPNLSGKKKAPKVRAQAKVK